MNAGSERGSGGPQGRRKVRCVLWTARGAMPPSELDVELGKKGIEWRAADDAHGAMALLVSWAKPAEEQGVVRVLILVEPSGLGNGSDGVRALLDAADLYAPDAARWVYVRGANPALRALVESDVKGAASQGTRFGEPSRPARGSGAGARIGTPRPEARPLPLRIAPGSIGDTPVVRPGTPVPDGLDEQMEDEIVSGSHLTDEELAMLLSDDPLDEDDRPRRGSGGGRP
ncbi:MAG: hypothetical protein KF838_15720 [Phycisphaeraceae bacterium]|nr:MAG: hypothetical protein KF838_15720 [Phycisphaeraceae bacterium]